MSCTKISPVVFKIFRPLLPSKIVNCSPSSLGQIMSPSAQNPFMAFLQPLVSAFPGFSLLCLNPLSFRVQQTSHLVPRTRQHTPLQTLCLLFFAWTVLPPDTHTAYLFAFLLKSHFKGLPRQPHQSPFTIFLQTHLTKPRALRALRTNFSQAQHGQGHKMTCPQSTHHLLLLHKVS